MTPEGLSRATPIALRKQLDAIADPAAREQMAQAAVATASERGKAISMASYLEIDAVIDPAETRRWILRGLKSVPAAAGPRERRFIDTW